MQRDRLPGDTRPAQRAVGVARLGLVLRSVGRWQLTEKQICRNFDNGTTRQPLASKPWWQSLASNDHLRTDSSDYPQRVVSVERHT